MFTNLAIFGAPLCNSWMDGLFHISGNLHICSWVKTRPTNSWRHPLCGEIRFWKDWSGATKSFDLWQRFVETWVTGLFFCFHKFLVSKKHHHKNGPRRKREALYIPTWGCILIHPYCGWKKSCITARMVETLWIVGQTTYQLVQDFFHPSTTFHNYQLFWCVAYIDQIGSLW